MAFNDISLRDLLRPVSVNPSIVPRGRADQPTPIEDRLARRIDYRGEEVCWEWRGNRDANGYGMIELDERTRMAYRLVYEVLVGPIPDGYELDHLCRNRGCVNPAHLEAVTHRENTLRGESFAAINAQKTHCPQGHEYTPENTYRGPSNRGRQCRICKRSEARLRARARRKAARGQN